MVDRVLDELLKQVKIRWYAETNTLDHQQCSCLLAIYSGISKTTRKSAFLKKKKEKNLQIRCLSYYTESKGKAGEERKKKTAERKGTNQGAIEDEGKVHRECQEGKSTETDQFLCPSI